MAMFHAFYFDETTGSYRLENFSSFHVKLPTTGLPCFHALCYLPALLVTRTPFREEHDVGYLPVLIPIFAIVSTGLGFLGVLACNRPGSPLCNYWGKLLFLSVFLVLGLCCFIMAFCWPRGVVPTCLATAAIFLAMLWQPSQRTDEQDVLA